MAQQLDLLTWAPPSNVVRFPSERWMRPLWQRQVDATAVTLAARKTPRGAENFWSRCVEDLRRKLTKRGATEEEITQALNDFHDAVERRLQGERGPKSAG